MSHPVGISKTEYKKLSRMLLKQKEVICMDPKTYVVTLLVARALTIEGKTVAKIVKGFQEGK